MASLLGVASAGDGVGKGVATRRGEALKRKQRTCRSPDFPPRWWPLARDLLACRAFSGQDFPRRSEDGSERRELAAAAAGGRGGAPAGRRPLPRLGTALP